MSIVHNSLAYKYGEFIGNLGCNVRSRIVGSILKWGRKGNFYAKDSITRSVKERDLECISSS